MERFTWDILVAPADLARVRGEHRDLASQTLAWVPEATSVLITVRGGVTLLDVSGESLDLDRVPLDLLVALHDLYRLGLHDLQRPLIKAAYQKAAPRDAHPISADVTLSPGTLEP